MLTKVNNILTACSDLTNNLAKKICVVLMGFMLVLVLVTVFFRYVFGLGLGWSDEISRYANIWIALLGASIAFKYGNHVGIEFFRNMLPADARRFFKLGVNLFVLAFLCIAEYYFYRYFLKSRALTPAMQIPYAWIQVSLFAGFGIMLIHLLSFIGIDIETVVAGRNGSTPPAGGPGGPKGSR
jgi:TRAP-type C4-dicarboxylate transport system permease small subunit